MMKQTAENRFQKTPEKRPAPKPAGFILTKGNLEMLRLVWQHRFLRREHLAALTGRCEKKLHERLLQLSQRGFLKTIKFPQQKHIYAIGREGLSSLVGEGIAPAGFLDNRLRTHELTQYYLEHEMLIVDVHVALTRASNDGPIQLVDWTEGKDNYDSVVVNGNRIPVSPDAVFTLRDARRPPEASRACFFLEADLSTENHRYFQNKIVGAANYFNQGLHVGKFNVKAFRVLTVTRTRARARNLCRLAQSLLPQGARKLFFFTSLEDLPFENPAAIFDPICFSPRDQDESRRPLLPPPAAPTLPLHAESPVL
jgi:hypothetical protein